MSHEGIMENYGNIVGNLERIVELEKFVRTLATKYEMLDARILKLETIIVKLCNEDGGLEEDIDWAEIAQQRRDDEEGYRDR